MPEATALEEAARRFGTILLRRIEAARPPDFHDRLQSDPLVAWSARGPAFLARVFQLIDVYPALERDEDLLDYLTAYLGEPAAILPGAAMDGAPDPAAVRGLIEALRRRFTAGETLDEALVQCRALHDRGLAFTLDILGEAILTAPEADAYTNRYLDLIRTVAPIVAAWPACPQVDRAPFGTVPRLNISVKLTSLYERFDAIDPAGSFAGVAPHLRAIFRAAMEHGASINVDLEQYEYKDLTFQVFKAVLMEDEFRAWPEASLTVQMYLPESGRDLADLAAWAQERGTPVQVRLVKGAYWDQEVQRAAYHGWPAPVYREKSHTDAAFEAGARFLLEHHQVLRPALAGHNVRSGAWAMAVAKSLGLGRDAVEHQVLHGLGEEARRVLVETGHRVRVYVPFGRLVPGMAYLVRRLLEGTAETAFLRQLWRSPFDAKVLLAPPKPGPGRKMVSDTFAAGPVAAFRFTPEVIVSRDLPSGCLTPFSGRGTPSDAPFRNEPVTDFSGAAARAAMVAALDRVRGELGRSYPLWINGRAVETEDQIVSVNPGRKAEVVGRVAAAGRRQAAAAIRSARRAFPGWAATPAEDRAAMLLRAAAVIRRRRLELAAWEVFEEAKDWRQADADVTEAIDYLEYYAREAVRLSQPRQRDVPGEDNEYFYEPRGVVVAITPWNFPLAILAGVTTAAAAGGNAVIMKPSGQSPVIAAKFMEVWNEAGIPPGVIQYLPGRGGELGDYLVKHPDVDVIAFTGSREVGLRIERLAAVVRRGQTRVKRVVAEMGGKNAIIVARDADLDQAVPGVLRSAFGYQGQKCSACSRVIVEEGIYDEFLERLVGAAGSLPMGPAWDPHAAVGPVISEAAVQRITRFIEEGRRTARVAFEADPGDLRQQGFYVGPVILAEVDPKSAVAQEEIFGPVLSVIRAADFDLAVTIANGVPFGLTGGLYCRHPGRIRRARWALDVGNLYVNRGITGALVDRQPFGGRKLSGIGSKAGGPDYLLQFVQPKTFTEYTVRRGFAPPQPERQG